MELDITALDLLPAEESQLKDCQVTCSITCHGRTCMITSA
ncbi:ALQxL family class IV lanthipeptide [Streptosporangium jomthongense]|uniref:ALQxL family class IV lanthipeptide n=1 Tax=Streptosporangium jomthongense TaxID=1193683 RepID=A0ABV8EUL3_9ACTN